MTFEYNISNDEIQAISKLINKRLDEQIASNAVFKELSALTEQKAKQFACVLMGQNAFNADLREIIKPIVKELANEYFSNKDIIQECIKEYFDTDSFKKKQLSELQKRVNDIKKDLGIDDDY